MAIAATLGILLVFFTTNPVGVHAKIYSFTATISPTQVNINQLATYTMTITNTGESTIGSANIAIPAGFTILSSVSFLNPPTLWDYGLSATSISISASGGGSVIPNGENVTFTLDATSPASSGVATWSTEASTSIDGGGVALILEGEQPTVTITSPQFIPPTISASPSTINNNQLSLISQLSGVSGGVPPYNYQWLEAFNGGTFSTAEIRLGNGEGHPG